MAARRKGVDADADHEHDDAPLDPSAVAWEKVIRLWNDREAHSDPMTAEPNSGTRRNGPGLDWAGAGKGRGRGSGEVRTTQRDQIQCEVRAT